MELYLDDEVDLELLKKTSKQYQMELADNGSASYTATLNYAWCMIRTQNRDMIRLGIQLMNQLYKEAAPHNQRESLFYLAVGYARLKEWDKSLELLNQMLQQEPQNVQAKNLKAVIQERLRRDGFIGMGIVAFAGAAVLAGIGLAVSRARR